VYFSIEKCLFFNLLTSTFISFKIVNKCNNQCYIGRKRHLRERNLVCSLMIILNKKNPINVKTVS